MVGTFTIQSSDTQLAPILKYKEVVYHTENFELFRSCSEKDKVESSEENDETKWIKLADSDKQ